MDSPLTQEDFNITYEYMFGEVNKDANKMFNDVKDFEMRMRNYSLEQLHGVLEYLTHYPLLRKRQDMAEKQLVEYTPQQMELFTIEAEGLVNWYIGCKEEL